MLKVHKPETRDQIEQINFKSTDTKFAPQKLAPNLLSFNSHEFFLILWLTFSGALETGNNVDGSSVERHFCPYILYIVRGSI